jgi:integration host factor subunit beta
VVKSELIQALKETLPDLRERDVELAVNCILEKMIDSLAQGEHIEIRGFGTFDCRIKRPRLARNPKTGETVHFKPAKELKNRVGAGSSQCASVNSVDTTIKKF